MRNDLLLHQYNQCLAHMNELNPTAQNELVLFHGTNCDAVELINERGFDRSMAGKHATALGLVSFCCLCVCSSYFFCSAGTYFARDAFYSCNPHFSPPNADGFQFIYCARVAVGRYMRGASNMRGPPRCVGNDEGQQLFADSVVDNVAKPTMYCVFRDAQSFPEFVIKARRVRAV